MQTLPLRSKRILRIAAILLAVGLGLFLLGPVLAGEVARRQVHSWLERRFDASVTTGGVSAGWWDGFHLTDLRVVPRGFERPLLRAERVDVRIPLTSLVLRPIAAHVQIVRPHLLLEKDAQGRSNANPHPPEAPRGPRGSPGGSSFQARVTVVDGRFTLLRAENPLEGVIEALNVRLHRDRTGTRIAGRTRLTLDGGAVDVTARLHLPTGDAPGPNMLGIDAEDVPIFTELEPFLGRLHPIFHTLHGRLEGRLHTSLLLSWTGPPEDTLQGSGSLSVRRLRVSGSPAAQMLLDALGERPGAEGELRAPDLRVEDGRCLYRAAVLRLGRTELRFNGWVGLDRRFELLAEIPLTESILRKARLERLQGRILRVPFRGTFDHPRLDFARALSELAGRSSDDVLEDRTRRLLEDLLRGKRD